MKTVSDDLFRLIKSLTGSEKGYFKKYAVKNTPGRKNNYIVLFETIDKMDNYDEELLKKKLKHISFDKQLPVYKNYLFNLILKSLYRSSTYDSVNSKISDLIQNANILSKKSLHKEALKYLNKAKDIAVKFESTKALLEILSYERSIIMTMPDKNVYQNRTKVYNEQLNLLEFLEKQTKLSWLSDKMVMYVEFKGDFRTEENENEIKKIMSDPLLNDYENLTSFTLKRYILHIHTFEQYAKEDLRKIQYYLRKQIDLVNNYKYLIPLYIKTHINTLVNYLLFSNLLKDRESVQDALSKINSVRRSIKNKIPFDVEIMIMSNTCYAEILIYYSNYDINKGRHTAKKIEQLLEKYKYDIPMALKVVLLYNTSRFWFLDRNFDNSLKYINTLLNEIPASFKQDIYNFSRLFQLIIHLELGNFNYLEDNIESVFRYMKGRKAIYDVELAVFRFLRRIIRSDKKYFKNIYNELLIELEASKGKQQSRLTLSNFNFILWAKSKISDRTMVQLGLEDVNK